MQRWERMRFLPNRGLGKDGARVTGSPEHIAFSRYAAGEGMVLLKNNGLLPLEKGTRIAIFGKAQVDYIKGGGGSGDVYCDYVRNIYDGIKVKEDEGKVSIYHDLSLFYKNYIDANPRVKSFVLAEEAEITDEQVCEARENADVAIITICRYSTEGSDRTDDDFYLSDKEQTMVDIVCRHFSDVIVVLNVGGVVDTEWFKDNDAISAVLLAWNGGMEGGLAVADILTGDVNPSGKLCDTFAKTLNDYPSSDTFKESNLYVKYYEDIYVGYRYFETIPEAYKKVNYPFGFGLSYTDFEISNIEASEKDGKIIINADVTNIGKVSGKEVLEVYYSAPQGLLGKPSRELGAFKKTRLLMPGETQSIMVDFPISLMASFDDLGKIQKSAYVLEKGNYEFHIGNSVRNTKRADFTLDLAEDIIVEQLTDLLVPLRLEKRMLSDGTFEELPTPMPRTPDYFSVKRWERHEGDETAKDITFDMVADGRATLDRFLDRFSTIELIEYTGGKRDRGVSNTAGMGGDVDEETGVDKCGVPCPMTTDGPAGIRAGKGDNLVHTTAFPCASLLACTWDAEILYLKGKIGATEAEENNLSIWLTPGMNIHRNPRCGRNFEYFSEDPVISGVMASAEVMGIQSMNISACPKHFACNNKEECRCFADAMVSERALREIYLKGFEICVKTAKPWLIMTSYNLINGFRAGESKDLLEGILRGEWGYDGLVTTDWGAYSTQRQELMCGNDIKMYKGDDAVWVAYGEFNVAPKVRQSVKRLMEFILRFK